MTTRSTRGKSSASIPSAPSGSSRKSRKDSSTTKPKTRQKAVPKLQVDDSDNSDITGGSDFEDSQALDSDNLDEDFDEKPSSNKRKRSPVKKSSTKSASPKKKLRKKSANDDESDDLADGREVVGKIVQAPTTGRVPAGQISANTLDFLRQLKKPECNDREWCAVCLLLSPSKLRQRQSYSEPVYRHAEQEWKAFIEEFTNLLVEVDTEIPPLPPKDVIYRIYRDIRFSNDKTPYKTGLSASFSRSGRKGIFAGFKPDGESLLAAGSWCPGKNELATIRSHIQRNPARLRRAITSPAFEKHFGEGKPHPKGLRRSIFGMDDELKTAPKGIDKNHPDIDLLKCRSFAVVHHFTEEQVLSPDFKEKLCRVVEIAMPFVHCLNDMMTLPVGDSDSEDDED
ncbi:hypothetical protein JAAARDRAFT_132000 [Jaapia argillacea MUCL 33604]|uniref:Uncharacterized protein n=1 Tax=Jaapia argillacea MUCL 33604 TaxID=933084 RepID=A0A067PPP1_9AGAM|nr:hypothetical protein JAAARDRAFT_132000 [Jaapia argillacea MUCL 33604]